MPPPGFAAARRTAVRVPCQQCGARVHLSAQPHVLGAVGTCTRCGTTMHLVGGRTHVRLGPSSAADRRAG